MKVELEAYIPRTSVPNEPSQRLYPRVNPLTATISENLIQCLVLGNENMNVLDSVGLYRAALDGFAMSSTDKRGVTLCGRILAGKILQRYSRYRVF